MSVSAWDTTGLSLVMRLAGTDDEWFRSFVCVKKEKKKRKNKKDVYIYICIDLVWFSLKHQNTNTLWCNFQVTQVKRGAFHYTVKHKTILAAQMTKQHKIKHRKESWEWAEMWKHSLTAHGTEYIQIERKEMKSLFDLKHGCGQYGSDVEGDDLRERQEFKQHKHSSMLLRVRRSAYLPPPRLRLTFILQGVCLCQLSSLITDQRQTAMWCNRQKQLFKNPVPARRLKKLSLQWSNLSTNRFLCFLHVLAWRFCLYMKTPQINELYWQIL